jgi:predicted glycoside hydrolase/deacetylase ChbG (UPF0249 family)
MDGLIVNADDFGLTPGINAAILALNRSSAVSSATLMATAPGCAAAAAAALLQPTLGVGCHVVLVDGGPALPADEIRSLLGADALTFRPTLGRFVSDLLLGRILETHIEAEAIEQIRRLQKLGIRVTHVDTHKHTHMFPPVLRPLIRAAMACGVRAIRNPFEPAWSIRMTASAGALRKLQLRILNSQRGVFLRLIEQAGLKTTNGTIGILATGSLDKITLRRLLAGLPGLAIDGTRSVNQYEGVYELCCHPGYIDTALESVRTKLRASREVEVEALQSTFTSALAPRRIHYGDLT